jgi:hypothetical protein
MSAAAARVSRTIDVSPDFYWEASSEDGNAAGGINPPRWSLDGRFHSLTSTRCGVGPAAAPSA